MPGISAMLGCHPRLKGWLHTGRQSPCHLRQKAGAGRPCPRTAAGGEGPGPAAAAAAAPEQAPSSAGHLTRQFTDLAAALAPGTVLKADATPLGRGLVATAAVPKGTALIGIDWCHMLCITDDPRKAGNAFGRRVLQDWQALHQKMPPLLVNYVLSSEDWFLRLTALMLFVLSRVEQGPLTLYRRLLPKPEEMCCLMNYLPEERALLQSPALELLAAKERDEILGLHARIFGGAAGELRALRLAGGPEDTLWAACLVNSRCFSETVDGEVVSLVVPCADMANHLAVPNAGYAFSAKRDCFELTSLRDIAAGEEVCISYGCQHKSNEELMRDYGFVMPANPNDRIPFATGQDVLSQLQGGGTPAASLHTGRLASALRTPAAAARLSAAASDRLPAVLQSLRPFLRLGQAPAGALAAASSGGHGTAPQRTGAAGGQQATASAAAALEELWPRDRPPPGPPSEAELRAERQAVAGLREQCARLLAAHGTSLQTDEALLQGAGAGTGANGLSPRARQAVECRLERKRLIAAADEALALYEAEGLR